LSGKPAFAARVRQLGKNDWTALHGEMRAIGFEKLPGSDACEQYRYDRTLDSMGQRVTAQVFKCPDKLDAELGYTFL
jgi:hypothetical protein